MRITNLHDARDDIPIVIRGTKLKKDGKLNHFWDEDLIKILKGDSRKAPIKTRIKLRLRGYNPPRIVYPSIGLIKLPTIGDLKEI